MTNAYNRPHVNFAEGGASVLQKDRIQHDYGSRAELPSFYRFVILETIFDPSIINEEKIAYFRNTLGVSNAHLAESNTLPRNTIVARRVITGASPSSPPPMFLYPFFPPSLSFPCQPGEHVWVIFENQSGTRNDLGYWMCRIVEPGYVEDVNHTHAPRAHDPSFKPGIAEEHEGSADPKYDFRPGAAAVKNGERYTIAETAMLTGEENVYETLISETDAAKISVIEPVPRFRKRPGDVALEGSNNTLIVLGRDRTGAPAKYTIDPDSKASVTDTFPDADVKLVGAGAIDLVAGRGQTETTLGKEVDCVSLDGEPLGFKELGKSDAELVPDEGNPNFISDRSRVYIAQRTKVDANLGIDAFNTVMSGGPFQGVSAFGDAAERSSVADYVDGDGAIVVKSDKVRLIARSDLEIIVTGHLVRDEKGRIVESSSASDWAAIVIKANGDIIFRPSDKGYIKLGGDEADRAILCTDAPATAADGVVDPKTKALTTTMGGAFGGTQIATQGTWAKKVLVTGAK